MTEFQTILKFARCNVCGKEIPATLAIHIFDDKDAGGINMIVCEDCHSEIIEEIEKLKEEND